MKFFLALALAASALRLRGASGNARLGGRIFSAGSAGDATRFTRLAVGAAAPSLDADSSLEELQLGALVRERNELEWNSSTATDAKGDTYKSCISRYSQDTRPEYYKDYECFPIALYPGCEQWLSTVPSKEQCTCQAKDGSCIHEGSSPDAADYFKPKNRCDLLGYEFSAKSCDGYGPLGKTPPAATGAASPKAAEVAEAPTPRSAGGPFPIISTDHSSGATGHYFNFNKADVKAALGGDPFKKDGTWFVRQFRGGKEIWEGKVVMWASTNGGSNSDGHGRRDEGAAPDQFKPGDELEFRYVVFEEGLICEEQFRLEADCGFCGPQWGDEVKCAELCNKDPACTFFTYFHDDGCRIYSGCGKGETGAATTTYRLTGVEPPKAEEGAKPVAPSAPSAPSAPTEPAAAPKGELTHASYEVVSGKNDCTTKAAEISVSGNDPDVCHSKCDTEYFSVGDGGMCHCCDSLDVMDTKSPGRVGYKTLELSKGRGLLVRKYTGFFDDDFAWGTFKTGTPEESATTMIDMKDVAKETSYMFIGKFTPPEKGEYTFRLRSRGASYLVVDGHILIDNGGDHGSRKRDGVIQLDGEPVPVVIYFGAGEKKGRLRFRWKGGPQKKWSKDLAMFKKTDTPTVPDPSTIGVLAKKFAGYFDNDLEFPAFKEAPQEEKQLMTVDLGNEGEDYSYFITAVFHPPKAGSYSFRTRSDDASFIVVDGEMLVDNGNTHGSRTREGTVALNGPAEILVVFGQKSGGAKCEFEWKGGDQGKYTTSLALFSPVEKVKMPERSGMKALKYSGYFDNNLEFEAFKNPPQEEKYLNEVDLGDEGSDYSYIISGVFHPPQPDTYYFRTRSDDASYLIVNGKLLVDNGNTHGTRTREASIHLDGPAKMTVFFGEKGGGAKCEFEWRGGRQDKYTRRLGLFTPLEEPSFPDPYGLTAMKFDGYFDNDFEFPAFEAAPKEKKLLPEVKLGKEGDEYSYLITGMFNPPVLPGDYSFRTRSDDASYIIVDGKLLVDDGNEHGMRTRAGDVHLTKPAHVTIIFGQNKGGAGCEFEWKGMSQSKWTRRLGQFAPLDNAEFPPPSGMKAKKYDGYFDNDFEFPAFSGAPKEEKTLREVKLGKEGDEYSYLISGMFHPPTVPGDYSFRTRSDDASYIIVNGKLAVDDGNEHGMRTRDATVHLIGPTPITVIFGQNKGGAGLEFEWKGMGQSKWTRRLGVFTPLEDASFPAPSGMKAKKFDGYFNDDFDFPAFHAAPKEEKTLRECKLGNEGQKYSYLISGRFNPPTLPGTYSFRTRSDDASYLVVNGELLVDDGNRHGMRTREGTVKLTGPADITIFFGQDGGGAGLDFEWRGEAQNAWTRRLGLFTPLDLPTFPPAMGFRLKRYDGYFANDFDFPAFQAAPTEEKTLREVDLKKEGEGYSYILVGVFHPPEAGIDYQFRTRSDDASFIVVNGQLLTDDGNEHGMRTREGTVRLTEPAKITVFFGQNKGGAGLKFEWRGGKQDKWTNRLGVFTPSENPEFPPPMGMIAKKFDGYFADDFDFPAFKAAPKEEKKLREVKLDKEGDKYSYIITGVFHPPEPGDYSFRTRSDDASYIILNGEILTDDGKEHGMRTREATAHLTGPAKVTIFFGQNSGGAGLRFEWKGGRQDKWTDRLGLFTPEANPEFPPAMGMTALKFDGYFDDDFEFPAFKAAPKEEKKLREVELGDEGSDYSYLITGTFHPPTPGEYFFRTRSDDASYLVVNGELIVDNGHTHGMRTREASVHLTEPAVITIFFGEKGGGAGLKFEWKGGRQDKWTTRCGIMTPEKNPTFPAPMGMRSKKYDGYFHDDFGFEAFKNAPKEEKTVLEIKYGDEGNDYSYVISGLFHPPGEGDYSFRTRSDDASYVIVNGQLVVDNGHPHGSRTREGTVHLSQPAEVTIFFGEWGGGAKLDFEWRGGRQAGWTRRLGLFSPVENPTMPKPFGLQARKFNGYFNDNLNFGPFAGAPASEQTVREVKFGDEGSDYSYVISGVFHPPTMGATYTFKTRSDDSSIVMVNGKEVVDNRNLHGMQSRSGSVKLDKPVAIDIYFGEKGGGAGLKFEWKGGSQASFTDRLGLFTPSEIGGPGCFGDCYLCYCNAHPDLQNAFCGGGRCTEANAPACKSHWEAWGQKEGRVPNPAECSAERYLCYCNSYPDLKNAFCGGGECTDAHVAQCEGHWNQWGHKEGRISPESCVV